MSMCLKELFLEGLDVDWKWRMKMTTEQAIKEIVSSDYGRIQCSEYGITWVAYDYNNLQEEEK